MKRASIGFTLAFIFVCGFILIREIQGRQLDSDKALAVMTFNVGTFNAEPPDMIRVGELISRTGTPEVLLLQEVPEKKQASFLADNL